MGVPEDEVKKNVEDAKDGGILENRSCTDCLMIIVAFLFVAGWVVILSVAVSLGRPARILKPTNFDGYICGDNDVDYKLDAFPNLWIPRASRLSYGICVATCPEVGDFVCNNRLEMRFNSNNESDLVPNSDYSHTAAQYVNGSRALSKCTFGSCTDEEKEAANRFVALQFKLTEYSCFLNWYSSGTTLYRCLPFQENSRSPDNITVAEAVGDSSDSLSDLADFVGVAQFFNRGFGETKQAWLVILLSALTCCAIAFVWLFLLRWIMKPIVYLCIILVLCLLIIVGYLAMRMGDDLENVKLPGDTATSNQVKLWRALQYGAWILAAMYLIIMLWMIKRIKIAIAIMREASYTFTESPGLIVVPPIVFVFFCGWVVFFVVTSIYIQTIGKLEDGVFEQAARNTFGDTAVNYTLFAINSTETMLVTNNVTNVTTVNTTEWTQDERVKILHAYNFFGFLWASAFCIMFGFFVTAMTGVVYYFSATQTQQALYKDGQDGGKEKETGYFTIPRSVYAALRYHLGTILFGSLLIAIIQFVRALFMYFKEQFLEDWKDSATVACAIRCIDYWLWYIQKVVEIISKNAFIVCCSLKTNFCSSAGTAVSLMAANAARVSILMSLATVACWVLKLFIVGCNMVVAWALINTKSLTEDESIESGLFPLLLILIMSFIIASLFVNVYECLVDTTLMTFLIDEEYYGGEFMVQELAELTDMFKGAELARREYEAKLRAASRANKEPRKEKEAAPSKEPA